MADAPQPTFEWKPQPQAASFVRRLVDEFLQTLPQAAAFAERLDRETGNRFVDLIDTIYLPIPVEDLPEDVEEMGWEEIETDRFTEWHVYQNTLGSFPKLAAHRKENTLEIDLKVDSLADFVAANRELHQDEFPQFVSPVLQYRRQPICESSDGSFVFGVAERRGWNLTHGGGRYSYDDQINVFDDLRCRKRQWSLDDEEEAWLNVEVVVYEAVEQLGRDLACHYFFAAEREYWQRRNAAGRFQKARQDAVGIGWANHDHQVYRSSRRHFHRLVALWEKLGFERRERFSPGPAAGWEGWGAQVMEQPVCGIVTVNEVDLSPDELAGDFAREPMEERDSLGTVGLWCGLHGESVLQAGMHRLGCTFDFDALREQMEREGGIATMPMYTDFPHLKQALTEGELWAVAAARAESLLRKHLLTESQARDFYASGAVGSHLEIIERKGGYMGFGWD